LSLSRYLRRSTFGPGHPQQLGRLDLWHLRAPFTRSTRVVAHSLVATAGAPIAFELAGSQLKLCDG
jgi:hypothetical protein